MGLGKAVLEEIVQDLTPQLGGPLDVNGFAIVSTANGNIVIEPDGSGVVTLSSDLQWPDGKGPVLGAAQDYSIKWDGADAVHTISAGSFVFVGGSMGVGEASPLGKLHIVTADTGFGVDANADELILENDGPCGLTIISAANQTGNIYFGDANTNVGRIIYNHSGNVMTIWTGDSLRITLDNAEFDVVTGAFVVGSDAAGAGARTDATRKLGKMFSAHYANAEEPVVVFIADSDGSDNIITYGDGSTSGNMATEHRFTVGATDTTQGSGAVNSATMIVDASGVTLGAAGAATNFMNVTPDGDVSFTGTAGLLFGNMYAGSEIVVPIGDANPTELNDGTATFDGWTAGELNGVTFPTGGQEHFLTVSQAGKYRVVWDISAHIAAGGATQIHGGVMVDDGAIRDKGEAHRSVTSTNDTGNMGGATVVDCPNGTEEISLWVLVESSNDLHVNHGNLYIEHIAGT